MSVTLNKYKPFLKAILDAVPDGVMVIDEQGMIESVNPVAASLFGYFPEELPGKSINILLPEPHGSGYRSGLEYYRETGSTKIDTEAPIQGKRKDNSRFLFLMHTNEVHIHKRKFFVSTIRDISNIQPIEAALLESENRLNSIIQTAVDGIITIDRNGIIESFNTAASELFGYSPEEVTGNNISMLMPEPYRNRHDGFLKDYQRTRKKKIIGIGREVTGLKKNGTKFPFRLSVSEVVLESKVIYTGIVHDISEERKAQKKLEELNEQLENKVAERTDELAQVISKLQHTNANLKQEVSKRRKAEKDARQALAKEVELGELKSRFVSMASHEFRTPLAGILSSVGLIARYTEPGQNEKRQKHIARIRSSVQNLTNILDDFLSLDKLAEGKISCTPATFKLSLFARELTEYLQQIQEGKPIINHVHKGNDENVFLDPHLLRNVVINLLSNAIKYTPDGRSVEWLTKIENGRVFIAVKDQGLGIPEQDQKYIFERFFRAKNATNIQGTGLGLHIVKQYLSLMDGQIEFESTENTGTTFTVQLPQRLASST